MSQRTITLSASGSTTAVPDRVLIMLGVQSEAATAREALDANSAAMRKVIEAVKAEGLEDRDVQTSDFSIGPRYEYTQDGKPPRLVGYQVSNVVNIRVKDISRLGLILDKAVSEGSNQVNGIQFQVSDQEVRLDEARKAAVANARRMAELYAAAAGVELGPVMHIEEAAFRPGPVVMMRQAAAAEASAVPIESGEQTLQVTVTITWSLT
ncbi:MAG: SIMPL domain-containing protein [Hyphomicrobiaceae bacterium]